ncbi:MAG TPA: glycogen/starch/alpha-glucan phosphorylase [Bauldia sp.]|nr:glycogen/starch/alpha-glucan phosphorylase [Bauldia sp.]
MNAPTPTPSVIEPAPRKVDAETIKAEIVDKLAYSVGKDPIVAKPHDWLAAAILVVRDRAIDRWMESTRAAYTTGAKRVYYLSLEFLIGRLLRDAMSNLGLVEPMTEALKSLGVDLDMVEALEPDAALGNGGLGRLAACFMESMATLAIPAYGYGIRYVHGLFKQEIQDGNQVEMPEDWLSHGNLWEFERREAAYDIGFGGMVTIEAPKEGGRPRQSWKPQEKVLAVAYDTPIVGWRGKRVNTLRLWSAQALDPIRLDAFNQGDHLGALADRTKAETITRVLYPADSNPAGQELRLRQEYFFVSASLQDLMRRHIQQFHTYDNLPEKVAIQLNDTHPAVAVAELMRILVDVNGISWAKAFDLTRRTISYTNHTLLPEALESWPVSLFERMLPRHMQIIYEINAQLLEEASEKLGQDADLSHLSLIDEHNGRRVRMGQLAFVGSHSINGVSALHTELMKKTVFRDLNRLYPGRINNKTNGVTPRRWLMQANAGLTRLIGDSIGDGFLDKLDDISGLNKLADDRGFQEKFAAVKLANKQHLARLIEADTGISVDPAAMFDVQVKRIHEYKRQLLNILEAVALYDQLRVHPEKDWTPRVKIFGGKAAPSYWQAKLIIHLINDVARVVNSDPAVHDLLKIVFMPNYNVSLAEAIIPAADLSEQISTAGMEASGTGNMKFALNGALTIGTLDGANVEIREKVGAENIVIFGLTADDVDKKRREGHNPRAIIGNNRQLGEALDTIASGIFSPDDTNRYRGLVDNLMTTDWFLVTADYAAYYDAQRSIDQLWSDKTAWYSKTIRNTANVAWFSADRTIGEYARDIWDVPVTA